MSYAAFGVDTPPPTCGPGQSYDPDTGQCVHELPEWLSITIVAGVLGLVGFAVWSQYKIASSIAEKEGVGGVLAYEAGSAAIGLASHELRRNPKRRGRRRSRR